MKLFKFFFCSQLLNSYYIYEFTISRSYGRNSSDLLYKSRWIFIWAWKEAAEALPHKIHRKRTMLPCVILDTCFYILFIVFKLSDKYLLFLFLLFAPILQFTIFATTKSFLGRLTIKTLKSLFSFCICFFQMFEFDSNGKQKVGCGGTMLPGLFGPLLENLPFSEWPKSLYFWCIPARFYNINSFAHGEI